MSQNIETGDLQSPVMFEVPQDTEASWQTRMNIIKSFLGRGALVLGLALGATAGEDTIHPRAAEAVTDDYPDKTAAAHNTNTFDWWVDENGNGTKQLPGELISSRGYYYRNCTDWAAWRAKQITDVTVPWGWGNGKNWDDAASAAEYSVDGVPEVGDIAVWDDGDYGHVAVVEGVDPLVVSEYNHDMNNKGTYGTRTNPAGIDHFIDLNGPNSETPPAPSGDPTQPVLELAPNGGFVAFARHADSKELYHSYQTGPGTGWSNWLPVVGGELKSQPTIHKKADGSFVIFALDHNGNLVHTYQNGPGGGWSALTGINGGGVLEGDPQVTSGSSGGLVVFARGTDKQLYHIYQNSPNGSWSGWNQVVPGQIKSSPVIHKKPDGSLIAFAINNDNKLVHTYQNGPGGGWSPWTGINGNHTIQGKVEVEVGANGGLVVFARDTNNQLYHVYQTSPTSGWSNWNQVVSGETSSSPTIHKKADGSFVAFALNAAGQMVHSYQSVPGGGWSPWTGLDGGGIFQGPPEVEVGANGGLIVYARGTDKKLYHSYQTSPTSGWSTWQQIAPGQIL